MISAEHLRKYIIRPTLEYLGLWSQAAENLLLGTCAQESSMGFFLHQLKGPANGIYDIEPPTEKLIWQWLHKNRPDLESKINDLIHPLCAEAWDMYDMIGNLYYATAMARILYLSIPEKLPDANNIGKLGEYWDQYYNRNPEKGTVQEFVDAWDKYVQPYI